MKQYYYITNGSNGTEEFKILKSNENYLESNTINVLDEFGNGAGWSYEVYVGGLIQISKEEYEELACYIKDGGNEKFEGFYEKYNRLLQK